MPLKSQTLKGILTTPGDMVYVNASGVLTRLPVGANASTLGVTNNLPAWTAGGGGGVGPGPNGSIVLDTFVRANAATLGANWSADYEAVGWTSFQILSNHAKVNTNLFSSNWWNANTFGPNCEAWATVQDNTSNVASLVVRLINPGTSSASGYRVDWDSTAGHMWLMREDNTVQTQLGANITASVLATDRVGISVVGSTLTAWLDTGAGWVNMGTRTDTTYAAAGRIAIRAANDTGTSFSNFGGGTI